MYNMCFLGYLLLNITNITKKPPRRTYYHVLAFSVTCLTFYLNISKKNLGRNKFGSCSIIRLDESSQLIGIITLFFTSIGAILIYFVIKKQIPNHTRKFSVLKRNFTNFYGTYLKLNIYVWSTVLLAFIAQNSG